MSSGIDDRQAPWGRTGTDSVCRHVVARQLYDLELQLGIIFGHAYNGNSNTAANQLETMLERVRELREDYEAQSDEQQS